MSKVPDEGHPFTERTARQMFAAMPPGALPELAIVLGTWEVQSVEVREVFRDRARRFMAGDLSVAPWMYPKSQPMHVG